MPPEYLVYGDRLYGREADLSPQAIAARAASAGSVEAAATALGISPDAVQAAIQTSNTPVLAPGAEAATISPLATLREALGLLSGIAVLAVVLGGLVLVARLDYLKLPATAVVDQLPKGLLISVAVGQVLVPALVFVGIYALLRAGDAFGDAVDRRVLVPGVFALLYAAGLIAIYHGIGYRSLKFWSAAGVLVLTAGLLAIFVGYRYHHHQFRLTRKPEWLTLAITYGALVMVLAAVLAATHPLPDAKACVSGGLEIRGSLIAESGDRVFLGEPTLDRPRRIVALPTAQVEELFIGPYAARARCNPPPAAIVAAGQAKKSTEFRETAHELLQQLDEASSLHTAAKPAVQLATAVRVIGNSTLIVAGAGDRADDSSNNALTEDVKRADAAGTRAAGSALFSRRRSIG